MFFCMLGELGNAKNYSGTFEEPEEYWKTRVRGELVAEHSSMYLMDSSERKEPQIF